MTPPQTRAQHAHQRRHHPHIPIMSINQVHPQTSNHSIWSFGGVVDCTKISQKICKKFTKNNEAGVQRLGDHRERRRKEINGIKLIVDS